MADRPSIAQLVAASRLAQGLPPTVRDEIALSRVATLIASHTTDDPAANEAVDPNNSAAPTAQEEADDE